MSPCMRLCHGDGGSNNDLTDGEYVIYTIFHTKMGVRSFKLELLPLAVYVIEVVSLKLIKLI